MQSLLNNALHQWIDLAPRVAAMAPQVEQLGQRMLRCWQERGKVLIAGNGGSAADSAHFAEELVVRFQKNRRGLAAVALCDSGVITCCGNDFGFDRIFARQVEALGNPGDLFIAMTTSGQSANLNLALEQARAQQLTTIGFLGRDGGAARALCDLALIIPCTNTARIQEAHKMIYHCLCEWIDQRVD